MFGAHKPPRAYINEANALFSSFANRHDLRYQMRADAPVELLWEFPEQKNLTRRITLCLQNNDELNFGVESFWSYFFPFPDVEKKFENLIDAWVEGSARIVPKAGLLRQVLELQVLKNGQWKKAYGAVSLSFKKRSPFILQNKAPDVGVHTGDR